MATAIPANRARFTLAEVARATGGTVVGDGARSTVGVATDTRVALAGTLFVALRGERFDAHAFIAQAEAAGSAALLVDRRGVAEHGAPRVPHVLVDDTTKALGDLARFHRDRWGRTLVAIGGSAGKTSTKDLTHAALSAGGARVHKTVGNLNNHIGVPMTLLQLDEDVDLGVIEVGTNTPGEIKRLTEIVRPDVGVITLVAPEHLEGLGSLAGVAEEEAQLLLGLGTDGIAIANGDVSILAPWLARVGARVVWRYGTAAGVDLEVTEASVAELPARAGAEPALGTRCQYRFRRDGRMVGGHIALLGEGAAMNVAAALSVAYHLGHDVERAMEALVRVPATEGRMRPRAGIGGALILDDTYNANPRSVDMAIDTAAAVALQRGARLVVVLGAMGELGASSKEHHLLVGERVAAAKPAAFVGVGEAMAPAVDLARNLGAAEAVWEEDSSGAAARVRALLAPGDVALVKGSRSMRMERVVEALLPSGATAAEVPR